MSSEPPAPLAAIAAAAAGAGGAANDSTGAVKGLGGACTAPHTYGPMGGEAVGAEGADCHPHAPHATWPPGATAIWPIWAAAWAGRPVWKVDGSRAAYSAPIEHAPLPIGASDEGVKTPRGL